MIKYLVIETEPSHERCPGKKNTRSGEAPRRCKARDLTRLGLPREYVQRLADRGALVRVARGLYADPDAPMSAQRSLAEVARAVPKGTVCLLSALKFHRLTTQAPPEVWIALGVHAWRPRSTPFPVRTVYFSGAALTEGAETHTRAEEGAAGPMPERRDGVMPDAHLRGLERAAAGKHGDGLWSRIAGTPTAAVTSTVWS
jgi:hypothetical protein